MNQQFTAAGLEDHPFQAVGVAIAQRPAQPAFAQQVRMTIGELADIEEFAGRWNCGERGVFRSHGVL